MPSANAAGPYPGVTRPTTQSTGIAAATLMLVAVTAAALVFIAEGLCNGIQSNHSLGFRNVKVVAPTRRCIARSEIKLMGCLV